MRFALLFVEFSCHSWIVVVFYYCRAKSNTQIANSANMRRQDLAQREEVKDQNKNVA